MSEEYVKVWDLESIFPGGGNGEKFQDFLVDIEQETNIFADLVAHFDPTVVEPSSGSHLEKIIQTYEELQVKSREASAYISCLHAQNTKDTTAQMLVGKRSTIQAHIAAVKTKLDQQLALISDDTWEECLQTEALQPIAFVLNEYRNSADEKMAEEQEVLMNDLAVDGYHGWSQMYDALVGSMEVEIEEDGKKVSYSVGQAANKLSHPDRAFRKHVSEVLGSAWQEKAQLFSQTINHLAGFRLASYKHRGWDHVLKEPLDDNRMQKETLDAMWGAIEEAKTPFVRFLHKKAELLQVDKLAIYDIGAPIYSSSSTFEFTEAASFIMNHFNTFSPKMAQFAKEAFEKGWIEAEDRANKRPGGFCTSFPYSKQARIFMTYSGSASNVATLAHELGHAYHQSIMSGMNGLNQRYAKNVAETASTFAEMIIADASVKDATTKEEKISLLATKIQRSIAFFMNIHARFLFEERFYKERKEGLVSVDRLNSLMEEAQREAYQDAIENTDPTFWASKLHFHKTSDPFYNFPYTFGYLFSLGIYAKAQEEGSSFEDQYIELLKDTGRMSTEELAEKHLQVDLTKRDFWSKAIQLCVDDVEEFLTLVE